MILEPFFEFCLERERIRKRKESGQPWPWTEDLVLRNNFFCNVYREDDRTTRWFRDNVRNHVSASPQQSLSATVAFRWFNRIETGQLILNQLRYGWDERAALRVLKAERAAGRPIFSPAYIICCPGGPKLEYVAASVTKAVDRWQVILEDTRTLQAVWSKLCEERGLGAFMAYEIVTDLRWTDTLRQATDIHTWANPGPGCTRGLGWLLKGYRKWFVRSRKSDRDQMMGMMREILDESRRYFVTPVWEMREVEHCLCEYDKYLRIKAGRRAKRRYP
jgi:hypothetical protein